MFIFKKAYYSLIGFFFCISNLCYSQDQNVADRLLHIYNNKELEGIELLKLLEKLAFNETKDLNAALNYSNELIKLAKQENNGIYLYEGYINKGNRHREMGDLDLALDALIKSSEVAKSIKFLEGEAVSYTSIADVYSEIGNNSNAELYYDNGITILRTLDKPLSLASALLNAGYDNFLNNDYDKALEKYNESSKIFQKIDYPSGSAYNIGNIGMVYAKQGKDQLAKTNINEAITILEEFEDYYAISEYLTYMSDIYRNQGKITTAVDYAQTSLDMAERHGLKKQISESNLTLSNLYKQLGNPETALALYKDHIVYRDSIKNLETIEEMADLRTNFEVSQKQAQVDLLNQQKRNQLIIIGFTSLLLLTLFWYYRTISKEKKRSENLLLNILPEETAKELKEQGKVTARKFESVSVLFTDFKGFTNYAEHLPPEKLVERVDYYFSNFDKIIEHHGLEKIKTIGDAYMCAGGLHGPKNGHAKKMVSAALDMAKFVSDCKTQNGDNSVCFDIRIGINTGPVVAGVVGTKKFAYDIWGDTVNIASRMESNSEPGKINVSHHTYSLVKEDFNCQFRGTLSVKNRGEMKMYFVDNRYKALV